MKGIELLYRLLLKIYPRSFYDRFAGEMNSVFLEGLAQAKSENLAGSFLAREFLQLPGSWMDAYYWSLAKRAKPQLALASTRGGNQTIQPGGSQTGWGAAFMAGLPHIIIGLLTGGTMLINALAPEWKIMLGSSNLWTFFVLGLTLLGVVIYNFLRGWQNWSSSWVLYLAFIPAALLLSGIQLLPWEKNYPWLQVVAWTALPLLMSYILYRTTCAGQLKGLLAALPMALFIWTFFQEFVPDIMRGIASIGMWGLAFTSAALSLRSGRLLFGILLSLGVTICSGLLFVYLSVYHGGTLPSYESGPTLVEVIRQFLPFLGISCAILLGPQLAVQLRNFGKAAGKGGGKIAVKLALGGLLVWLANELANWAMVANSGLFRGQPFAWIHSWMLWVGGLLYLVGLGWLLRAILIDSTASFQDWSPLRLALLVLLLPCVPFTLFLFNQQVNSGGALYLEAIQWLLLGWIALAAWVVSREPVS